MLQISSRRLRLLHQIQLDICVEWRCLISFIYSFFPEKFCPGLCRTHPVFHSSSSYCRTPHQICVEVDRRWLVSFIHFCLSQKSSWGLRLPLRKSRSSCSQLHVMLSEGNSVLFWYLYISIFYTTAWIYHTSSRSADTLITYYINNRYNDKHIQ